MKIKLNCHNLFTYFLFNTTDERLSKEDQKTAKLVTILFVFTLVGHAICRLFFYKKISTPPKGSATEKTQQVSEKITPKKSTATAHDTHQSKQTLHSDSSSPASSSASGYVSCKYDLKEIMKTTNPGMVAGLEMFDPKDPFANKYAEIFGSVFDTKVPEHGKAYDYFKEIKLVDWPHLNKQHQFLVCGTKDVEKNLSKLNEAINTRFDKYEKTFKFTESVQALKVKDHLNELTMEDLEAPALRSPIGVAIVSLEDLADFRLSKHVSERQLKIIKLRMPHFDKVAIATIPDIEEMTLRELHSLSGKQLSQIIDQLPLQLVTLISDEQIKEINFSKLDPKNDDHIAIFDTLFPLPTFTNTSCLSSLTLEQIYSCWGMLGSEHAALLSSTIIKQIDFNKYPFSEEQFAERFPSYRYANDPVKERELSDIKLLSDQQVADCWRHFTDTHISYLSDEQIQHLPLDAFKPGDEELLSGLFYMPGFLDEEARRKMALLSSEQVKAYWELFGNYIYFISKEQLQNLDPALPMDLVFQKIFPKLSFGTPTSYSKIQWLKMEQIERYWNLFDAHRITYLSDEQLQKLDFALLEEDIYSPLHAEALFDPKTFQELDEARRRFKLLNNTQKEILERILSSEAYSALLR